MLTKIIFRSWVIIAIRTHEPLVSVKFPKLSVECLDIKSFSHFIIEFSMCFALAMLVR